MNLIFKILFFNTQSQILKIPQLQSHRGLHKGFHLIENTLPAFRNSKKYGFEMLECDVRLTRDGVPVLFHDADLNRIYGLNKKISDISLDDFLSLTDATSLKDLLLSPDVPEFINIEIKKENIKGRLLEEKICEEIKKYGQNKNIIISSFNPFSLYVVQQIMPEIPLALLVARKTTNNFFTNFILRHMLFAPFLRLSFCNMENEMLTEDLAKYFAEIKLPLAIWTVNNPERAQELLLRMKVSSIITDLEKVF